MNVTKIILDGQVADIPSWGGSGGDSIPAGLICMWSGSTPPDGWALCDGTNNTPDLRGRFVLGSSETHAMGETGGEETHTMTLSELASHYHYQKISDTNGNIKTMSKTKTQTTSGTGLILHSDIRGYDGFNDATMTGTAGSSTPFDIMPPYYTLAYIMKL